MNILVGKNSIFFFMVYEGTWQEERENGPNENENDLFPRNIWPKSLQYAQLILVTQKY